MSDTPTHEELLAYGLKAARDAVDAYPDLRPEQRRVVLGAYADLIRDLKAAGVIR